MKKILAKKTIHMVKDMSDLPESNEEVKINGHVKGERAVSILPFQLN